MQNGVTAAVTNQLPNFRCSAPNAYRAARHAAITKILFHGVSRNTAPATPARNIGLHRIHSFILCCVYEILNKSHLIGHNNYNMSIASAREPSRLPACYTVLLSSLLAFHWPQNKSPWMILNGHFTFATKIILYILWMNSVVFHCVTCHGSASRSLLNSGRFATTAFYFSSLLNAAITFGGNRWSVFNQL